MGNPSTRLPVLGFEQLTTLSTAKGLASIPSNARSALMQATGQNVRWRPDGATVAPTAAIGMLLVAGAEPYHYDGPLAALEFIEIAVSGTVEVTYFG